MPRLLLAVTYCDHMLALLSTEGRTRAPVPSARVQYWIYARIEALARLARYAKAAYDAGVPQRQTAHADRLGDALGDLLSGVLDDLNLSTHQHATAPAIVRKHLERFASRSL
jgi:hypothetical protein